VVNLQQLVALVDVGMGVGVVMVGGDQAIMSFSYINIL